MVKCSGEDAHWAHFTKPQRLQAQHKLVDTVGEAVC